MKSLGYKLHVLKKPYPICRSLDAAASCPSVGSKSLVKNEGISACWTGHNTYQRPVEGPSLLCEIYKAQRAYFEFAVVLTRLQHIILGGPNHPHRVKIRKNDANWKIRHNTYQRPVEGPSLLCEVYKAQRADTKFAVVWTRLQHIFLGGPNHPYIAKIRKNDANWKIRQNF